MPVSCGGLRRARSAPGRRAGRGASWLCFLPGRAEPEGKAQQRGHEQQYGQLRQEEKEALIVRKIHDDVHEQRQPCQQYEKDARAQHAKRRQQEENEHGKIEDAAQHRVQNAGKRQRLIEKEHDESGHGRSQRHDGPPAEQGQQHRIEGRREDRQADEQEDMIDRYLEKGTMYVLEENGVKAECVVTDEGSKVLEIKNIAVKPEYQGCGYGKALINFLIHRYTGKYSIMQVGTGDSALTVPFYEKCGFTRSHCIPNFFTDHYDHPIFEEGKQLVDMVYLKKEL